MYQLVWCDIAAAKTAFTIATKYDRIDRRQLTTYDCSVRLMTENIYCNKIDCWLRLSKDRSAVSLGPMAHCYNAMIVIRSALLLAR